MKIPIAITAAASALPVAIGLSALSAPADKVRIGYRGPLKDIERDPARNLIWILMFQRDGKDNPDNSDVRIAFQDAAAKAPGQQ